MPWQYTYVLLNDPNSFAVLKLPVPRAAIRTFHTSLWAAWKETLTRRSTRIHPSDRPPAGVPRPKSSVISNGTTLAESMDAAEGDSQAKAEVERV
jgi:hypothetical protein